MVSGDSQHKDDRLGNSTIEFLPANKDAVLPQNSFKLDPSSAYVGFGKWLIMNYLFGVVVISFY